MRKFIYVDESTFDETEVLYEEELVYLAQGILAAIVKDVEEHAFGLFPDRIGKKLSISVNLGKDRVEREIGKHLYKVSIEKL